MVRKKAVFRQDEERERAVAYRVCCLYFENPTTGQKPTVERIAAKIYEEMRERLSRQMIYRMIDRGIEFGFLRFVPPLNSTLEAKLLQEFRLSPKTVHVINTVGEWENVDDKSWGARQVAWHGAELVMSLIKETWQTKPANERDYVRIGLGAGRATLDFSRRLAELIRSDADVPPVELIAITGGCDANHPEYSSASFFNLFPAGRVKFVGLSSATLVPAQELAAVFKRVGAVEAYSKRDAIDVVVSSMGDPSDPHDLLAKFLANAKVKLPPDCKGSMQYRPYNDSMPITERKGQLRAVTLFELRDYHEMVTHTRNRHVVLLARQCAQCGITRARSLLPLLKSPDLKVWSHIVLDVSTAKELLTIALSPKGRSFT